MGYQETKAFINANIKQNGENEITGSILNTALNDVLDSGHEEVNQLGQEVDDLDFSISHTITENVVGADNTAITKNFEFSPLTRVRITFKKKTWAIENVSNDSIFFAIFTGGSYVERYKKGTDNFPLDDYYDVVVGNNGSLSVVLRADVHQLIPFDISDISNKEIPIINEKISDINERLYVRYEHIFTGANNTLLSYSLPIKQGHKYNVYPNLSTWPLSGTGSQYIIYIDGVLKVRYYPEDFPNNPVQPYQFTAEQDGTLNVSFRAASGTEVTLSVNDLSELRTDEINEQIEELKNNIYGAYYAELYGHDSTLQEVIFSVNAGKNYKLVPDKTIWDVSNVPTTNAVFAYYIGDTRVLKITQDEFTGLESSYNIAVPVGVTTIKVQFRGDLGVELGFKLLALEECIGDTLHQEILDVQGEFDEYKNNGGDILRLHPKEQILPILANFQKTESYTGSIPYGDNKNFVLMWFSDIHLRDNDSENVQRDRIIRFYNEYAQYNSNTMIDDVIASGDVINRQGDSFESLWAATDAKSYLMCIGNHEILLDTPPQVGGVDMKIPYFSKKYCYDRYFKNLVQYTGITIEEDQSYWYKDYSSCKLRLIALDFMHWNDVPTLEDNTVLAQYPDGGTGDNGEQEQWLKDILNETLDSTKDCYEYSVLIVIHCPLSMTRMECSFTSLTPTNIYFGNNNVAQIIDTFQNTNGGKFVAYLCGHTHVDMVGTVNGYSDQFIRTIDCTRIAQKNGDIKKVYDTNGQDLFELVCINTNNHLISFNRIGCNWDRYGRHLGSLVYDYNNHRIVFNG